MENYVIPYITRMENGKQIKYVSQHIAQSKLFSKYFLKLHPKICACVQIKTYPLTKKEEQLFDEINSKHLAPSKIPKQKTRFIIQLTELKNYFIFLISCFYKLSSNDTRINVKEKFGLIRVNIDSVIPYHVINNEKYVPFFYFENKFKELKSQAIPMDKWSYIYIKLCYLIQGIKFDFSNINSFLLISINIVKRYLAPNTQIQEYWPAITDDLINLEEFKRKFPVSLYPFQETEFSPESDLVQHVPAINIADTECIPKMVCVKNAISFI